MKDPQQIGLDQWLQRRLLGLKDMRDIQMDIDETHDEHDGIYCGVTEYKDELNEYLEAILEEFAEVEHRLSNIIYNKGWDCNNTQLLNAEDCSEFSLDWQIKFDRIYSDLYNLQKELP